MTVYELATKHPLGLPVYISPYLHRSKIAVWTGNQLVVSYAMHALLCDPESADMTARAIEVAEMDMDRFAKMVTSAPRS
jgi:hypothetical protein